MRSYVFGTNGKATSGENYIGTIEKYLVIFKTIAENLRKFFCFILLKIRF